ncbi:hypothetical protein FYK55_13635 [Roseiconus nitratireducens]|uniref:Magnetosome protein MamS/MamX domain-containing protein n=1 Tax=Roseiconus nitratireducens TaxID=2605748 RepID=A0A5M6D4Y5_9BACT|nr:hypothetical protein [Roseiconus nitratireducens]KAA5542577.1 hypothetical protein FYK55_13635 [Roseiconus nitratireducens]
MKMAIKQTVKKRMALAATLAAAFGMSGAIASAADEFGENTPYYEDDAWYDISEWFDGNDYNPTDEAIGRWDNETFEFSENATSTDRDNDAGSRGDYGYAQNQNNTNDDWFYDYYDDGYHNWGTSDVNQRNYYSIYNDTDDDGLYDSYAYYSDTDGDGVYEEFDYYTLNTDAGNQQQEKSKAQNRQKQMKSKPTEVVGTVEKTKTVSVRDRQHLVAMVKGKDGAMTTVDLGPKKGVKKLAQGDQLTVNGHTVKVGDKDLFIATDAKMADGSLEIDRNGQKFKGKVEKLKTVSIHGDEHQLAKVNTKNGKTMMVDLGPADQSKLKVKEGQNLTVQGVPAKVKDRVVLMARQVTKGENKTQIER